MEQYLSKLEMVRERLMYMGYWDRIESNWNMIMTAVMVAAVVFAILNCFWGYQMMRLWMSIIALVIGGIVGGVFALRTFDDKNTIFIAAVGCGMVMAMLANLVYRLGLVILCGGLVFLVFEILFPMASMAVHMGFVALGIVAGIAAFSYEDVLVTWVTGIGGGLGAARVVCMLLKVENPWIAIVAGVLIAALGIRFQYGNMKKDPDVEKRQRKLREKRGE
ncbi:MAG: hypothetical protein SO267_04780 [Lachnospiraceae bacterium]|nr:hypothetical protein [Lachnospiraceae bacterium]